ncbi:MAG: methylmalonyl-CoA mutase family protein [Alphaproteobacteria bacterium]
MTGDTLDLAAKGEGAALETWQAIARKALGNAADGILGTRADWPLADASGLPGAAPYMRGTKAARARWDIRTLISEPSPSRANAQALEEIAGGATSLWIDAAAFSTPEAALSAALADIPLEHVALAFDGANIAAARAARQIAHGASIFLGFDDFAAMARGGAAQNRLAQTVDLARETALTHSQARAISIDTRVYHNAGSTPATELATALASGVAYLHALESAGFTIEAAARQIAFILVTDANFVTSIAKLRALRRCWARVLDACGAGDAMRDVHVTAVSSEMMMTRHDAHTNILRTALAGFAAAVGGADAIALLPFDARGGKTSDEARRIACNTQSILLEEANVARVIDPAGGAFAIERASEALAQQAWREFQEIEAQGGMAAALSNGFLARKIAEAWGARRKRIARRGEWITGVSDFPSLTEAALPPSKSHKTISTFTTRHLDDEFEALRAASDAHLKTHGERPKIYLVAIGSEIDSGPGVAFARSVFESGGIEAVAGAPSSDAQSAAAAYLDSGISIAALCSSDAVYAEKALAFAHEVARAGARYLYFIGAPGDLEQALREAGVDEFVSENVDAIELLKRAQETLGIAP